jgi:hypothetical protein
MCSILAIKPFRRVLLADAGIGQGVAAGHRGTHLRVHDLFFGGLMAD